MDTSRERNATDEPHEESRQLVDQAIRREVRSQPV